MKRVTLAPLALAALVVALLSLVSAPPTRAAEVGFIEDYALAKDRTAALKQLIPNTDDFFYYHALYYQSTEQFDKVDATLGDWRKRYPQGGYPAAYWQMLDRQMLLTYNKNPQATLTHLRQRMGLHFNHNREPLGPAKPQFPTNLDPALISRDRLTQVAYQRHGGNSINGFEDNSLDWLIKTNLNDLTRRQLISRLQRPDYENLAGLVMSDLRYQHSGGFGQFNIHRQLLLAQLEDLLKIEPGLLNHTNFVNAYITKLQPNPDIDWRNDPKETAAYLDRLWTFVQRLAPAHNSLKAHVLYNRLAFDRTQGVHDRQRFMQYITLPKYVSYINNKYMELEERRQFPCDLNANYQPVTLLPIVGNDEPLIRSYLHEYFAKDTDFKAFEPYINDIYLKNNFAEVKIVNGLGDPAQWAAMISPQLYQQIKDRIDIDFAYTNREMFGGDEPVSADLFIKNVKTMLVKVYEVNAANYYRDNEREVDTDINLDGLVANKEVTINYGEAPVLRVKRHFEFPELTKPGVYVVDFIGNGKSSRVLVRKGKLRYLVQTGGAGQVFTVLNEKNEQVKNATLILAGHEYKPEKDGSIIVPFSNRPGRTPIILTQGPFASLDYFTQESENYQLAAGIHVDRESLVKRAKANVIVRPQLTVNGTPVSLSNLEDVRLVINSVDIDGVSSSKEVSDFKLYEDREAVYEFSVPERLHQLHFLLKAKVQNLSQGRKIDLAAAAHFALNEIDKTEKTEALHLSNLGGAWVIELMGKTGEPLTDRAVNVVVKHRDFRDTIHLTLQTNDAGRVMLGALKDIDWVQASSPQGVSQTWPLERDGHSYHQMVHGKAGQPLLIPYMGSQNKAERAEVSLLELRGGTFADDRFKSVAIANGFLKIDDLPRGDYDLLLKDSNTRIALRLTEGASRDGFVLSDYRQLEVRNPQPLQIEKIDVAAENITIKLQNASKFSRVHVFATRIRPAYSAGRTLGVIDDPEPYLLTVGRNKSAYLAGRTIGDEYRYILERKYAKIYPGNMLNRPGLLLNPWAIRNTETGEQIARSGDQFGQSGGGAATGGMRGKGEGKGAGATGDFPNLDFLGDASAVLLNLTADKDGNVVVKRADLTGRQHIHVVAVDPMNTVSRSVSLPEQKLEFVDLRLNNGLDPKQHFTEQKQISIVRKGQPFIIGDITTSKFEAYDTLSRVYSLYATLTNDPKLIEFSFILDWPKLKPEEKQEKYSKYACHELSFFIYKKDPKFFGEVVLPYLANKRDKTFMDYALLGDASASYLEPWEHGRLNIVERIVLAQKLKGEQLHTSRHVKDLYDLLTPDMDRLALLYQMALKGSALEAGDAFGFDAAKDKALPSERFKQGMLKPQEPQSEAGARYANDPGRGPANGLALGGVAAAKPAAAAPPPGAQAPRPTAAPAAPADAKADSAPLADRDVAEGKELEQLAKSEKLRANRQEQAKKNVDRARELKDQGGDDAFYRSDAAARKVVRQFYRKLDQTQEWVENNYYKLPQDQQNAGLVSVSSFWNDYAKHDVAQPFLSTNLAEASRNFPEMMLALAVLDLPFEAAKHDAKYDKSKMTLNAGSPMIVFHKEIKPAPAVAKETPILVSQNFFRHNDRYRQIGNERMDKYVTDEFLTHTVYGCQVVITNPTSASQKLDILNQIPVGAIPVLSGQQTRSIHIHLAPFSTQAIEFYFYFPTTGSYPVYPVHVAKAEQAIAFAQPFTFKVVNELSKLDKESWDYISQHGSDDEVFTYLKESNINRVNLDRIAFRMKDKAYFEKVAALLAQRHVYNHTLFSYGVLHNSLTAMREFLQHSDGFVNGCGEWLESPVLVINPVERGLFEFMEYSPLVNARAHQLGKRREIVNERMAWQYHRQLKVLSYKRQLDDSDMLAVSYYLLLQDRVDDALAYFGQVNPQRIKTRVQYDLMATYCDFYSPEPKLARGYVETYKDHPVDRWRNAFAAAGKQLDEVQGKVAEVVDKDDRGQQVTQLAATEPNFEFNVEAKKINVTYQNLKQATVNYYLMDVELLFSRNPFVQQFSGEFSYIRPNETAVVNFNEKATTHMLPLPEKYHTRNVLVEIVAAGQTKSQAYYANAMSVQVIENYGQVRVTQAATTKPLPKTYVKVYAMMQSGQVKFYKDGYTDLRGRFDYSSLNTNELDQVQKFSILVLNDEHGAVVREATPPKQ